MAEIGLSGRLLHLRYINMTCSVAWPCVFFNFKICSLDKQISTVKHFFSKSVYERCESSSKRSGILLDVVF